ncbi:MAG: sigma-B regulation protein RsbU (phosphoserine phosphatase) [Phycisphaerales bacterium]|jgi:sigma-B regulation protein RsbU (phosphoserine phosphatase)
MKGSRRMSQQDTTPLETRDRPRLAVVSVVLWTVSVLLFLAAGPHALAQEEFVITTEERAWLDAHPGIRVAPAPNFPPMEYFDDEGIYRGVMAEYAGIIEQKLGIEFEIARYDSWQGVVTATKAREADVWLEAQNTPERREFMLFTKPYIDLPIVIIVRRETEGTLSIADLAGLNVVVMKGYASAEYVRDNHPNLQLVEVPNIEEGLELVSFGVADAVIANIGAASFYIEKNGMTNLRVAGTSGMEWNLCIASRNDWPELHAMLRRALDSIPASERQDIYRRWIALEPPGDSLLTRDPTLTIVGSVIGVVVLALVLAVRRKTSERDFHKANLLHSWPIVVTGASAIVVVILAGRMSWSATFKRATSDVGNAQNTVLRTTSQAAFDWIRAREYDAQSLTQRPAVPLAVESLSGDADAAELEAQSTALRRALTETSDALAFDTFVVIAPDGQLLLAGEDLSTLTETDRALCLDMLNQVIADNRPTSVRVPTLDPQATVTHTLHQLLLVAAPVYNETGTLIGGLILAADTEGPFTAILQRGRMGDSGESYAFNRLGQMVSESRFDDQLEQIGIIEPDQRSILNVALRDPGGNLTLGHTTSLPPEQLSLTHMADQATGGNSASNLDGYNDYRGVPVIGTWVWDDRIGLGITTEIDVAEAYELRAAFTRQAVVGTGLAVVLITGLTGLFLWSRMKLEGTNHRLTDAYAIIKQHSMRMEQELNVGRDIQMSMVPLIFPAFPDHDEFSISAAIIPAREVGGDFYDFFFINDDHLCISIGDVSGKGVPSALFMAVTQTLIRSRAMDDVSTSRVLSLVNNRLSERNESCMFVTEFLAVLNTRTGQLTYTNAGHNPPMIRRVDGSVERLRDRHGPIIGASPDLEYGSSSTALKPGDVLVTYTDGVTEAMNPAKELFTEDRLAKLLETEAPDSDKQALDKTIDAIRTFENGAEQADDITILTLLYRGASESSVQRRFEISILNRKDEITRVNEFFEKFVTPHSLTEKVRRSFCIVFDELLSNVISHGYKDDKIHQIDIKVEINTQRVVVTISDDGLEFNPLEQAAPRIDLPIEERSIGGDGIEIVRRLVDTIEYERRADRNLIKITKEIGE